MEDNVSVVAVSCLLANFLPSSDENYLAIIIGVRYFNSLKRNIGNIFCIIIFSSSFTLLSIRDDSEWNFQERIAYRSYLSTTERGDNRKEEARHRLVNVISLIGKRFACKLLWDNSSGSSIERNRKLHEFLTFSLPFFHLSSVHPHEYIKRQKSITIYREIPVSEKSYENELHIY